MGGLTVSYINNKLAADGVTNATKQLILDFLNSASNAAVIAGNEPREGPVFDDPSKGYGDQHRDYDIGVTVAQRILNKRASLGGFTDLSQLAGINYFGSDKFNDLFYSFAHRVTEVEAIQFNFHTGAHSNDALSIRRSYSTPAPSPSWQKGVSSAYADSPAVYAISETQGQTICIRASFKANGVSVARIRAIGGGKLGRVKERSVSFDASGDSGLETFELEGTTFHAHGVDAFNMLWRWQWRPSESDPWRELAVTLHRVFIVLQTPTVPWTQTAGSTSLPWTQALEVACDWARGATDQDLAAGIPATSFQSSMPFAHSSRYDRADIR